MSKFVKTQYGNKYEILKYPKHYIAVAVTVDDTGIVANADGKKIVPAGTIVGGGVLADPTQKVSEKNDALTGAEAEGVLLNDVDVTYGPAPGAMLVHAFIDLNKLPAEPVQEAVEVLKQIMFLK